MRDFNSAESIIDKLFSFFPPYDSFILGNVINKSNLSPDEKKLALSNDAIEIMLVDRLMYADKSGKSGFSFKLNDLGREVQNLGGHFTFITKNKEEKQKLIQRQTLNDKKLIIDIFNAEFERHQGRKIKKWTFVLAISTLVLSLSGSALVHQLLSSNNNNLQHHNPFANQSSLDSLKTDLSKTKQELESLKEQIKKDTTR